MYAIVESGGKEYKVSQGDVIRVEKIPDDQKKLDLKVLLIVDGDSIEVNPNKKAKAEVVGQVKGKKIIVFKYKPKKNVRKKMGHRQKYTDIKITSIK